MHKIACTSTCIFANRWRILHPIFFIRCSIYKTISIFLQYWRYKKFKLRNFLLNFAFPKQIFPSCCSLHFLFVLQLLQWRKFYIPLCNVFVHLRVQKEKKKKAHKNIISMHVLLSKYLTVSFSVILENILRKCILVRSEIEERAEN